MSFGRTPKTGGLTAAQEFLCGEGLGKRREGVAPRSKAGGGSLTRAQVMFRPPRVQADPIASGIGQASLSAPVAKGVACGSGSLIYSGVAMPSRRRTRRSTLTTNW
jgi:hypothetical protein